MHTNWHSDDSDGASWMDEQGSEGRSSFLSLMPLNNRQDDAVAIAVQRIQFDLEVWQEEYDGSASLSPSLQDLWRSIAAKVERVSQTILTDCQKEDQRSIAQSTNLTVHRRSSSGIGRESDVQPESYWAGLWYVLGDVENDRNRRLGVETRSIPGDDYVLLQIWSCLDSKDFASVAAVCTDWFRLVYHSKLGQTQWEHIARNRWWQIQDWDNDPLVLRVSGHSRDWRKRFIALHKLSSNWQNGRMEYSTREFVNIQTKMKCISTVQQHEHYLLGDSRGYVRYVSVEAEMEGIEEDISYRAHGFSVTAVAINSDNYLAVTGSLDGSIRIHNTKQRQINQQHLFGHLDAIKCLDMNGDYLVSGSSDATARLWDTRALGHHIVFEDTRDRTSVVGVTFSPDGLSFIAFHEDGKMKHWDRRQNLVPLYVNSQMDIRYAASTWLSSTICVVAETSGHFVVLEDFKPLYRIEPDNPCTAIACFTLSMHSENVFVIASEDPAHALQIYSIQPQPRCLYEMSIPQHASPLRSYTSSKSAITAIDSNGKLHRWNFEI